METQELRDCTPERLADLEKNLRRQIFDAKMKNYTNQLDDTASLRRIRLSYHSKSRLVSDSTRDGGGSPRSLAVYSRSDTRTRLGSPCWKMSTSKPDRSEHPFWHG